MAEPLIIGNDDLADGAASTAAKDFLLTPGKTESGESAEQDHDVVATDLGATATEPGIGERELLRDDDTATVTDSRESVYDKLTGAVEGYSEGTVAAAAVDSRQLGMSPDQTAQMNDAAAMSLAVEKGQDPSQYARPIPK